MTGVQPGAGGEGILHHRVGGMLNLYLQEHVSDKVKIRFQNLI